MPPEVARQLAGLAIAPDRPLIVSDADEVLLQFLAGLETYIAGRDLYLDLTSYALTGNIRRRADAAALPGDQVKALLDDFFAARTEVLEPVAGAADALAALAGRAQIVVLTNVPPAQREARAAALRRHGMDYPVVANVGTKGAAVAALAAATAAPTFFLDDIPRNIASVAEAAADVVRIHFVADPRLARLIGPAPDSHARLDDWPAAHAFIERHLAAAGF